MHGVISSINTDIKLVTRVFFFLHLKLTTNLKGDMILIFNQKQFFIMLGCLVFHMNRIINEVGNWGSTALVTEYNFVNNKSL